MHVSVCVCICMCNPSTTLIPIQQGLKSRSCFLRGSRLPTVPPDPAKAHSAARPGPCSLAVPSVPVSHPSLQVPGHTLLHSALPIKAAERKSIQSVLSGPASQTLTIWPASRLCITASFLPSLVIILGDLKPHVSDLTSPPTSPFGALLHSGDLWSTELLPQLGHITRFCFPFKTWSQGRLCSLDLLICSIPHASLLSQSLGLLGFSHFFLTLSNKQISIFGLYLFD